MKQKNARKGRKDLTKWRGTTTRKTRKQVKIAQNPLRVAPGVPLGVGGDPELER